MKTVKDFAYATFYNLLQFYILRVYLTVLQVVPTLQLIKYTRRVTRSSLPFYFHVL